MLRKSGSSSSQGCSRPFLAPAPPAPRQVPPRAVRPGPPGTTGPEEDAAGRPLPRGAFLLHPSPLPRLTPSGGFSSSGVFSSGKGVCPETVHLTRSRGPPLPGLSALAAPPQAAAPITPPGAGGDRAQVPQGREEGAPAPQFPEVPRPLRGEALWCGAAPWRPGRPLRLGLLLLLFLRPPRLGKWEAAAAAACVCAREGGSREETPGAAAASETLRAAGAAGPHLHRSPPPLRGREQRGGAEARGRARGRGAEEAVVGEPLSPPRWSVPPVPPPSGPRGPGAGTVPRPRCFLLAGSCRGSVSRSPGGAAQHSPLSRRLGLSGDSLPPHLCGVRDVSRWHFVGLTLAT